MIWGDLNQQFDLTFYIFYHPCRKVRNSGHIQSTHRPSRCQNCIETPALRNTSGVRMSSKMNKGSTRRTWITLMSTVWGYLFSSSSWLRSSTFSLSAASTIARSWSIFASISSTCWSGRGINPKFTKLGNTGIFSKSCTCISVITIWWSDRNVIKYGHEQRL